MQQFAPANIGPRVRALRHEKQLTLEVLAKKSKVGYRTLISIEQNHTSPRVEIVQRIADGLGVPVADLFEPMPTEQAS